MLRLLFKGGFLFKSTVVLLALSLMFFVSASYSKEMSYSMPSDIDPSAKYFFFLHNYYVEKNGPNGDCKYYDILNAFREKGFVVISELRTGKIVPGEYAEKIVKQVGILLDAGVNPKNITVAGHSKGGVIALCAASQLANPNIGFVVMAGCGIKPLAGAYPDFTRLKGDFLSIYASSDTIAASCQKAFSHTITGVANSEIQVQSDSGHRLFFQPKDIWLKPVMSWLEKRK
jgi:hypothetical protein